MLERNLESMLRKSHPPRTRGKKVHPPKQKAARNQINHGRYVVLYKRQGAHVVWTIKESEDTQATGRVLGRRKAQAEVVEWFRKEIETTKEDLSKLKDLQHGLQKAESKVR